MHGRRAEFRQNNPRGGPRPPLALRRRLFGIASVQDNTVHLVSPTLPQHGPNKRNL